MDLGLEGKVALVTGGSRGIGRACVLALAREGAHVVFTFAGNEAAAQATVEAAQDVSKSKVEAVQSDVRRPDAAKTLIDKVNREHGALHVLVNNAGISIDGLLMRAKDEDLDRTFSTNVLGPFYLCRAAARLMMKAKYGRIIMMGSVVGSSGNVGQAAYSASKAAMEGLAKSIAKELASRNITANVVAPGFIGTDMTSELDEDAIQSLRSLIPSGELGRPEDVADAVCFLASPSARYITGHVLHVNGGMYMA
ncbi:MAG: 3-oxoacyl-ACP reductase family protein [Myxococcota bacterium]